MFLVGCTDYLPHRGSPYSLQWRNSKYLDSSSVFNLVQSLLTRLHEISHLHPAPPWRHLYKEPVLDLALKYIIFKSDGTLLYLRVNLLPPNLLWAGTSPSPVPSTWPRSMQELRVQGQFHSPKNIQVVKKKRQKPDDSTGFGSFLIFFTSSETFLWVPCHQRHHKTPPHSMGTW